MRVRGRRTLLNPPGQHSTAAIVAEIEDTRNWLTGRFRRGEQLHWDDETKWNLEPEVCLRVSDCDRAVTISIDFSDAATRRAALCKVDRMIEALSEFRDALEDEQRLYVLRVRAARLAGPAPKKETEQCQSTSTR